MGIYIHIVYTLHATYYYLLYILTIHYRYIYYVQVKSAGKLSKMRNFKDSGLKNSIFLLELVTAIEPRAVDWEVVRK